MKRPSLTEQYRPEFDRLVQTIVKLGWVFPQWRGPDFMVRRTSRHSSVTGKGCWLAIHLQVGHGADDADVFETIAHELVHAILPPILEDFEDHGPCFRAKLRELVRAHWPDISPWEEDDRPGRKFAYREDGRIAQRLRELLRGPLLTPDSHPAILGT